MIAYLINSILVSAVAWIFYRWLLQQEKMFRFNRWFLLLAVASSFIIPALSLPKETMVPARDQVFYFLENIPPEISSGENAVSDPSINNSVRLSYVLGIYLLVSCFLLLRFIRNLVALLKLIRRSPRAMQGDLRLVLVSTPVSPFSFGRYVFLDREQYEKGKIEDAVLIHEAAHVRQLHSLDIIFMELVLVLAWFNPFFVFIKRAIRLNHEFLADDAVLRKKHAVKKYQYLLLKSLSGQKHVLASSYHFQFTKKRLIMMTKTSTRMMTGLKQMGTFVLAFLSVLFFSSSGSKQNPGDRQFSPPVLQQPGNDTIPKAVVGLPVNGTKEGASQELLEEFQMILERYKQNGELKWQLLQDIKPEDRARLETIYRQMNVQQQKNQEIGFIERKPMQKSPPSAKQLESFKNPKVYGVWIDGNKMPNSSLNRYSAGDFSLVFISKLYGAAKKGRSYTHQVDLMTHNYFKKQNDIIANGPASYLVIKKIRRMPVIQ